jgi:hypothetical protein
MRTSSRRIAFWTMLAGALLALALLGAAGAGARDGRGGGDSRAAQAGGRDPAQESSRREDGHGNGTDEADAEARALLSSSLAPSVPTDPVIHGVAAGAVPRALGRGSVRLRADGRLRVEVEGLVIPIAHGGFPAGTARPIDVVSASLYCAPDSAAAVATTGSVPISADGDARIDATIAIPASCLAPIVLVHPNGGDGVYIAATGWRL